LQHRPIGLSVVVLAAVLAGCSSKLFTEGNLQPVKFFQKADWGSTTAPADSNFNSNGPVNAEDLVDASGACATAVTAAPAGDGNAAINPVMAGAPVLGGVALGMTECQVVQRIGQPGNIQISADPNNDRAAVLTYMAGPWPGIYRFTGGRLKEVERVATPEPPKPAKPARKKKAAPKTAAG
jgi:hypothetical protein